MAASTMYAAMPTFGKLYSDYRLKRLAKNLRMNHRRCLCGVMLLWEFLSETGRDRIPVEMCADLLEYRRDDLASHFETIFLGERDGENLDLTPLRHLMCSHSSLQTDTGHVADRRFHEPDSNLDGDETGETDDLGESDEFLAQLCLVLSDGRRRSQRELAALLRASVRSVAVAVRILVGEGAIVHNGRGYRLAGPDAVDDGGLAGGLAGGSTVEIHRRPPWESTVVHCGNPPRASDRKKKKRKYTEYSSSSSSSYDDSPVSVEPVDFPPVDPRASTVEIHGGNPPESTENPPEFAERVADSQLQELEPKGCLAKFLCTAWNRRGDELAKKYGDKWRANVLSAERDVRRLLVQPGFDHLTRDDLVHALDVLAAEADERGQLGMDDALRFYRAWTDKNLSRALRIPDTEYARKQVHNQMSRASPPSRGDPQLDDYRYGYAPPSPNEAHERDLELMKQGKLTF